MLQNTWNVSTWVQLQLWTLLDQHNSCADAMPLKSAAQAAVKTTTSCLLVKLSLIAPFARCKTAAMVGAGKDIEKACQGVFPLQNTFIRKVKVLRAPKFDVTKLMEVIASSSMFPF